MKNTIKFVSWLSKWNSLNDILTISLVTILFVIVLVYIFGSKRRSLPFFSSSYKPQMQRHNWQLNDLFAKPIYCNVCERLVETRNLI